MMRLPYNLRNFKKILLVEANNQRRWIGSRVEPEMHIPPIGLMNLATFARQRHPQLEFHILETSLDAPHDGDYLKKLDDIRPDLVGIRGINIFLEEYKHAAELTKSWGNIPVIGGGPIATTMKGALLRSTNAFDLLVKGEGEETFSNLFMDAPLETIPGIIYRESEKVIENKDRPLINNLDSLPHPDYRLIDLEKYEAHLSYTYNHRRQGVISTSRGCPFRCTYCFTFGGKTTRLRSAENVFLEMNTLWREHGIKDFYFIDDIFNLDKQRSLRIFSMIIESKQNWKLYFVNGLRADIMDKNFVDRMVEAGTIWVTYAIETANPVIQKMTKRMMNLDKAMSIINHTQKKGIIVNINTMYGFPTETAEMAQETLNWLSRLAHPSTLPYHFCLRGYDGCEVVEQAEQAGWDRSLFLEDNVLSYNARPRGTLTFSQKEMILHLVQYHERFGMSNQNHLKHCLNILSRNGYTQNDILDMYMVLQNRPLANFSSIFSRGPIAPPLT